MQVADDIVVRVERGEFVRGARLPSEAVLAVEYGVAKMTVRRALDVLRAWGVQLLNS